MAVLYIFGPVHHNMCRTGQNKIGFIKEGHWLLVLRPSLKLWSASKRPLRKKLREHIPVLAKETIEYLAPSAWDNIIDATLGYGGHAKLILEKISPNGKLLAIDQDEAALDEAQENLKKYAAQIQFERANFIELGLLIRRWPVEHIDGILIDLGASTPQLTGDRGFSFRIDSPLDMRMNPQAQRLTAADILNKYAEREIFKILAELGEERYARPIAHKIVEARSKPISSTGELVEIIKQATPPSYRFNRNTHFATNTFRALRMAVNDELENLKKVLPQAKQVLSPGGRLAVISFHSLEDRIVKNYFRDSEDLEIITSKPVTASDEEIENNPPSRSAKLRVAKKL